MDDVTVLLALQEKTIGRNGMIEADSYMMKRLGIVCPLDSNPGSSLQRVHCATAAKYNKQTENNIDYARPWEPIDPLILMRMLLVLCRKDLFGIGVWRFDDSS